MVERPAAFVVKAAIVDTSARTFSFPRQKTMYGGRRIAVGDDIFIFASENQGGGCLIARGVVTKFEAARKPRVARWTPRVSIEVKRTAKAKRPLGREQLKVFRGLKDGSGEAELDFKFYRQATNKIGGITDKAARYLRRFF